ncbi:MAG: hypothetical protein OHK0052_25390 [Anaerolineales bacterium]
MTLAQLLSLTNILDEEWVANTWSTVAQAFGKWHAENPPLVAAANQPLDLREYRLDSSGQLLPPILYKGSTTPQFDTDSPLVFLAHPNDEEAPSADVYMLGSAMYAMLTGRSPSPESMALQSARHFNPMLTQEVDQVLARCVSPNQGHRYANANELSQELKKQVEILRKRKRLVRQPTNLGQDLRSLLGIFLIVMALLLLSIVGGLFFGYVMPAMYIPTPTPEPTRIPTRVAPPEPSITPTIPPLPTPTPEPTATPKMGEMTDKSRAIIHQVQRKKPTEETDKKERLQAYVSVLDENNNPILNLQDYQFEVSQDDVPLNCQVLPVRQAHSPLLAQIVIDVSGSMEGEPLAKAQWGAKLFVAMGDPQIGDQFGLIAFSTDVQVLSELTTDTALISQLIDQLYPIQHTSLNDALFESSIRMAPLNGRRVVVLLSDGKDNNSQHSLEESLSLLRTYGVPVYAIGLQSEQFDDAALIRLANQTFGIYLYAPTPEQLLGAYQQVSAQIDNQYSVDCEPAIPLDTAQHQLRIRVTDSARTIETQRTYQLEPAQP